MTVCLCQRPHSSAQPKYRRDTVDARSTAALFTPLSTLSIISSSKNFNPPTRLTFRNDMADQPDSMGQLLATLGISHDELVRRSQEMRHFLSADASFLQDTPPVAKPASAATSTSWLSSNGPQSTAKPSQSRDASPSRPRSPHTPKPDSKQTVKMENVVDRQAKNPRRKSKKDRDRSLPGDLPSSPTPSNASLSRTSESRGRSQSQARTDASRNTEPEVRAHSQNLPHMFTDLARLQQ